MAVKTTLRSAANQNITGAPSAAEANRIRGVVNKHKFPRGVRGWTAEFGEDSTGDPAVWIWFYVKDEAEYSDRRIDELASFTDLIRSGLVDARLSGWPYVGYRNPPS